MINKDFFVTKKPTSVFLQKYIAYYYFHKCSDVETQKRYIFYPHYKNALSIYKNSITFYIDGIYKTEPSLLYDYYYVYAGIYKEFQRVIQQAPFSKIGIVFQPLGLNHFIRKNLVQLQKKESDVRFNYFKTSMQPFLDDIYSLENISSKVTLLDTYFERQYVGFEDERMKKAIDFLLSADKKYTVKVLAEQLEMNRKTLLRLFQKHLCCSVKDYINVVQFRKALLSYQLAENKPLLTSLAYDTGYYDQSEFINHFKKITGFNPTKVLSNIQKLGNEDTFWTLR